MAGMRLSVGVGLDLANLWRQLGQAQAGLNAAAAKQTNFAAGVAGGGNPAPSGGSSMLKDIATAAVAAKAAAGTIASPFLSLRVELRAIGLEMAHAMHDGSKDMREAGKSLKDVAEESAVQAGRLRQEDLEKHAARLRGGEAAAPAPPPIAAGARGISIPTGPIDAAGNAAGQAQKRFRAMQLAAGLAGGAIATAMGGAAAGGAAATSMLSTAAGAFVALQGASAAAGAAVGVAAVSLGGVVAAVAPFAAGAATAVVALRGISRAAKEIREVGLVQAFKNMRAAAAESSARFIQGFREVRVNIESVGKILNIVPGIPLRASFAAIRGVIGLFTSYEDRVGRVARKMGLLESVSRTATAAAAAPIKAANRAAGAVGRIGVGASITGAAAVAGLGLAVKAGSDLNETISKVETVFGDAAGTVKGDAARMAADFGVNNDQFMDSAASIGLIGKAAGQSEGQAAKFGSQFSQLALDMMSFYNVPVDEAMKAVRSGLVGEAEPMRRFGVLLSADRVEAEAFRMGLAQVGEELTEGQKVQARSSLIMKGLSDAQGDLARTADQPANLMRTLSGRMTGVATTIGQALMPGVQSLLSLLNQMAMDAEASSGGVVAAFEWISGAIQSAVEAIGVIYRNWGDYQDILAATVEARMINIAEVVGWLQSVFGAVLNWILENWTTILPDAFEAVKTAIMNLGENIRNFFTELWDFIKSGGRDPIEFEWTPIMKGAEFQSGAFVMPELKLTAPDQARIDAANERINKRETDRINAQEAKGPVKRGTLREGEDEASKKKSDLGRTLDLSAFREQLQQSLFDKDKQRGVKAQEKAADGIDKLNGKVDELNGNVKKINVGMQ